MMAGVVKAKSRAVEVAANPHAEGAPQRRRRPVEWLAMLVLALSAYWAAFFVTQSDAEGPEAPPPAPPEDEAAAPPQAPFDPLPVPEAIPAGLPEAAPAAPLRQAQGGPIAQMAEVAPLPQGANVPRIGQTPDGLDPRSGPAVDLPDGTPVPRGAATGSPAQPAAAPGAVGPVAANPGPSPTGTETPPPVTPPAVPSDPAPDLYDLVDLMWDLNDIIGPMEPAFARHVTGLMIDDYIAAATAMRGGPVDLPADAPPPDPYVSFLQDPMARARLMAGFVGAGTDAASAGWDRELMDLAAVSDAQAAAPADPSPVLF